MQTLHSVRITRRSRCCVILAQPFGSQNMAFLPEKNSPKACSTAEILRPLIWWRKARKPQRKRWCCDSEKNQDCWNSKKLDDREFLSWCELRDPVLDIRLYKCSRFPSNHDSFFTSKRQEQSTPKSFLNTQSFKPQTQTKSTTHTKSICASHSPSLLLQTSSLSSLLLPLKLLLKLNSVSVPCSRVSREFLHLS